MIRSLASRLDGRPVARLLVWLAPVVCLVRTADAQCTPQPGQLGCVTVVNRTGCPSGPGSLPGTNSCQLLRIDCFGVPEIFVEVRITEPLSGEPVRGTVLLGTGGQGNEFYENVGGGELVAEMLLSAGFRVVQRDWTAGPKSPLGWLQPGSCVKDQSCRYATLLQWVYDELHTNGAFAVTGNSGGSGEIGYALSTWGMAGILDVAVLSGGPPFGRLDFTCNGADPWPALCPGVVPANVMECGAGLPPCDMTSSLGVAVCTFCSTHPTNQILHEDSILHPFAVTHYESVSPFDKTRVHFVVGSGDCEGVAAPVAAYYHDVVTSEKVLEFVTQTPHWVPTTARGQDAIARALLAGSACLEVPAPTPATLSPDVWPTVGGAFSIELEGPDSGTAHVYLDTATAMTEFPNLGWWFLANGSSIGNVALDASGAGTLNLQVPAEPAFANLEVFFQALMADDSMAFTCFSNLNSVVIRP